MKVTQRESKLWSSFQRGTPDIYRLTRVEARHPAGHPDVIWWHKSIRMNGFIELKDEVDEIRPQQRIFLRQAATEGQSAWILARRRGVLHLVNPLDVDIDCHMSMDDRTRCDSVAEVWLRIVAQ